MAGARCPPHARPGPSARRSRGRGEGVFKRGPEAAEALRLVPSGSGDCGHLYDDPSECPPMPDVITLPEAGASMLVGREVDGDGMIPLPTVSGVHARLDVASNGGVTVVDLDSTNGTFVENDTCDANRPTPLEVGKTVTFGDPFLAKFVLVDDAA